METNQKEININKEKNGKRLDQSKRRKMSHLKGATIFLGIVLYVNLRGDYKMTWVDWAVIIIGLIFFIISLVLYLKEKKNKKTFWDHIQST